MSYNALLFCPEEKTALVVTQVLTELDFQAERCNEVFTAVKKLTSAHFDAIVVDCDNEQNAGLLFKSALHSGSNQQSLAVAVVEDQNGVAAAFRLGANLVLTKPISLEQSRSTLRVARGLLRKHEGVKPSPPPFSVTSIASHDPADVADLVAAKPTPVIPSTPLFPAAVTPAASVFEVDKEPEPALEPGEAALLESMPDPLVGRTFAREPAAEKGSPWPAAPRPADPGTSARARTPGAPAKTEVVSPGPVLSAPAVGEKPPKKSTVAVSSSGFAPGSAAAPARAKEPARIEEPETKIEPPTFSSLGMDQGEGRFGGEGSRKLLWIAASVLVVAIAGYAGWTKLHSAPSEPKAPALAGPSPAAVTVQPDVSSPVTTGTNVSKSPPTAKATRMELAPDITLSTEEAPAPKNKATRTPAAQVPVKSAPAAQPPDILVVTNPTSKPAPPPAPAAEPDTPAPDASEIASNSGEQAISGIMASSTAGAVEPAHSIQLSQGIAQGLLIKQVQPTYPEAAHRLRLQGAVELLANISKDGSITNLKQLSGDRILGRAAMDAVKQWKYKPYLLDGQPVEIQTQITVNFKMP